MDVTMKTTHLVLLLRKLIKKELMKMRDKENQTNKQTKKPFSTKLLQKLSLMDNETLVANLPLCTIARLLHRDAS